MQEWKKKHERDGVKQKGVKKNAESKFRGIAE